MDYGFLTLLSTARLTDCGIERLGGAVSHAVDADIDRAYIAPFAFAFHQKRHLERLSRRNSLLKCKALIIENKNSKVVDKGWAACVYGDAFQIAVFDIDAVERLFVG